MRRLILVPLLTLAWSGCADSAPVEPTDSSQVSSVEGVIQTSQGGGAWIYNRGEGQPGPGPPPGNCNYGAFRTNQITAVHTPSGRFVAKCKFSGLPPIEKAQVQKNWHCYWWIGGTLHHTYDSHWTRSPSGQGMVTCRFRTSVPPPAS